jgi:hypothetical protein
MRNLAQCGTGLDRYGESLRGGRTVRVGVNRPISLQLRVPMSIPYHPLLISDPYDILFFMPPHGLLPWAEQPASVVRLQCC